MHSAGNANGDADLRIPLVEKFVDIELYMYFYNFSFVPTSAYQPILTNYASFYGSDKKKLHSTRYSISSSPFETVFEE